MTDASVHPRESLQELLDRRLSGAKLASVELHLEQCAACQTELGAMRALRTGLGALRSEPTDRAFGARMLAALDAEDRVLAAPVRAPAGPRRSRRFVLAALASAAAAALALIVFGSRETAHSGLADAAFRDFAALRAQNLSLAHRALGAADLERRLADEGVRFRVFDLAAMGWQLDGGAVGELDGRKSGLVVYRNAAGRLVLCEMFEGRADDLPRAAERFEHHGVEFALYRQGNLSAIFWAEGDVLCVLVSDLPVEALRALAIEKAMLPT